MPRRWPRLCSRAGQFVVRPSRRAAWPVQQCKLGLNRHLLTSSAADNRLSPAHELLSGAFVPALLGGPTQWLVSDLSPTVRNCPATTCACHSGSRVTARIVRHWSQRNWRTGIVVCDISSRARSGTTIMLGTASHFGHLPFMVISGPQHSSRVIWLPLRNMPTQRCRSGGDALDQRSNR